jgi:hypothetical protein
MPIIAKGFASFNPAPEGPQQAVCVDVVDLGMEEERWGEGEAKLKPKVRIMWHSVEVDPETKKPYSIVEKYTLSLHEKAKLRAVLESWRGKKFTDEEAEGFDLETLLGVNAYISIVHNKQWANISAIMPLPKGMPPIPITQGFVRKVDRDATPTKPDHHEDGFPSDDDIPF